MEIIYLIQQKKNIGNFETDSSISESEKEIINSISKEINSSTLIIFWQFIIKVLDELPIVSNPILSLEMLAIRLIHLKGMPSYEKIIDKLRDNNFDQPVDTKDISVDMNKKKIISQENEVSKISKDQIKNIIQTKPVESSSDQKNILHEKISSLEDLINLSSIKKEVQLKYDLEKNVNLIKFSDGKIDISFNENLDKNFVRNLSEKLHEWTGNRWVITLAKENGQKTFSELQDIKKKEFLDKEKSGEVYEKFKDIFSDVELIEVKKEN